MVRSGTSPLKLDTEVELGGTVVHLLADAALVGDTYMLHIDTLLRKLAVTYSVIPLVGYLFEMNIFSLHLRTFRPYTKQ